MTTTPPRRGQQRGLGKGLGALIPAQDASRMMSAEQSSEVAQIQGARYAEIPLERISPNPRQPRTVFDPEALAELVTSIREIGLLQPVVVRPVGSGYELIAGERRLRACTQVGMTRVPAIIRHTEDEAMLRDALLENLHRANLNPLEEAAAYQQLLDDFGCTQDELAQRIGRSRPQVTNTLRLMRLPASVQTRVAAGVITAGHARALLGLSDPAAMEVLAARVVREGLSVRTVEELVTLQAEGSPLPGRPGSRKGRAKSTSQGMADVLGEVAHLLSDALDTSVTIVGLRTARSRGRVVVEVADLEDLRRVADLIARRRP